MSIKQIGYSFAQFIYDRSIETMLDRAALTESLVPVGSILEKIMVRSYSTIETPITVTIYLGDEEIFNYVFSNTLPVMKSLLVPYVSALDTEKHFIIKIAPFVDGAMFLMRYEYSVMDM